ncbi:MAG: ribose 5-phosphate isomerase B [Anaerolineae bacterium]|nr:ribose 5-phosphate isomerase B [Anaerolineae bacterium]
MRVALGMDHGGMTIKESILDAIRELGHEALDLGAYELDPVDDYPDFAVLVGEAVQSGRAERGIAVCGSGVGVTMAANKLRGIRACLCHDTYSAAQGVTHDDMNVLCLGGRIIGPELAKALVRAYLTAEFDGGERFRRRVNKVNALD